MTEPVGTSSILEETVTEHSIMDLAANMLEIVYKLHLFGIIHGDIHPRHFLRMKPSGDLMLIDFNCATLSIWYNVSIYIVYSLCLHQLIRSNFIFVFSSNEVSTMYEHISF